MIQLLQRPPFRHDRLKFVLRFGPMAIMEIFTPSWPEVWVAPLARVMTDSLKDAPFAIYAVFLL